jgi:2C-methyl-D-erythritol 2,4-cyclodiphosphate synthase
METKDIQEICDDCCDDPKVMVNNEYVRQVFQWLIDNGYTIVNND